MLKLRRVNTVAITDHNEIKGAIEYKSFLEKFNISVIIGEEIFTEKGEIIGLFLSEKISPKQSVKKTIEDIKKQKGIVYIPHPYDEKRYKTVLPEEEIKNNIDNIDIIEIHNGRNIKSYFSERQLEIGTKYSKVLHLVGSDAHTFIELGRNYNIIEQFSNRQEFIANLKNVKHVKKECIQISHHITKLVRLIRLVRKGNFNELYRIINKRLGKSM